MATARPQDHIHPSDAGKILIADALLAHLREAQLALGYGEDGAKAPPSRLAELRPPKRALHLDADRIAPRRCFDTRHLPVHDVEGFEYVSHEIVRLASSADMCPTPLPWRLAASRDSACTGV